jgi:heterodisulfide reductase subunit A-like polyferredoxin
MTIPSHLGQEHSFSTGPKPTTSDADVKRSPLLQTNLTDGSLRQDEGTILVAERIGVIGGGIVGPAAAREPGLNFDVNLVVVEKEPPLAWHQTANYHDDCEL